MIVSIRRQLLTLFVPFVFGLWLTGAVSSYWLVSSFSRESFDRELVNSADSVAARLRVKDGAVTIDLPAAAQAILKHDESDLFYYRVLGDDGRTISGDPELPDPPADLAIDVPKVQTVSIHGTEVRLAEIKVELEELPGTTVIVQVAETRNARRGFQEKVLLSIGVPQLLAISLGLFAVWYGIAKILTPLGGLQRQLGTRCQSDLSPVSDEGVPAEVYPLVRAINELLARLRDDMEAHRRFIANAAHQLRTPLAGLKTYSSIGSEMSEVEDLKHIIREVDLGIDRSSRMVAQLLALARADSADLTPAAKSRVNLSRLVSEVAAELGEQAMRKEVELLCQSADEPVVIAGEAAGLRHLIVNLVENALTYTQAGGTIRVAVGGDPQPTLTVADSGTGIPPAERERVFERFYRLPGAASGGSGLGLSIVREVANAHEASVSIEDGPGGAGTLVVVRFPARVLRDGQNG